MRLIITTFVCLFTLSVCAQGPCNNQTTITYQGYEYDVVEIGNQCWFAENCRFLPSVSPSGDYSTTDPYYYVYEYEGTDVEAALLTENYQTYGVLYNWPAVMTEGICPSGWHVPSAEEFTQLTNFLGGEIVAGHAMKSTFGWNDNNGSSGNGSNSSGFKGLPGGYSFFTNGFYQEGFSGYWWSSSETGSNSWRAGLYNNLNSNNLVSNDRKHGFSTRCITTNYIVSTPGCTDPTASNYDPDATEDDGNCCYSEWGDEWVQIGQDVDGEAAGDESGYSVSTSANGGIVAIGSRYNDGNGFSAGHVRIFENINGIWNQLGTDIDGEAVNDENGNSVSLSSDGYTVAIGAKDHDGNASQSGRVRIYNWDGISWVQLGNDIDGEAAEDHSGFSVSLSSVGDIVAIGAPYNGGNGFEAGHVRVYNWDGSSWTQIGNDIDGEAAGDQSGYSVSINSNGYKVAVGAHKNDGNGVESGHVRIYSWDGGSWTQLGQDIDGESVTDYSGQSVSISSDGQIVAIGTKQNGGNGIQSGHVRVYNYNGTFWTQIGIDIDGEASQDYSGCAVSLNADGDMMAIGAYNNDGNGEQSGHVRIYNYNGSSWNQLGNDIDGESMDDESGFSVSISDDGSRVAIGAPSNDGINGNQSGHVRVYEINAPCEVPGCTDPTASNYDSEATEDDGSCCYSSFGTIWNQLGQDIDGEAANDKSGFSVSMSDDGNIVAIGAIHNDGINGNNSGHVRVYEYNGSTWIQIGQDIDGEAIDDYSGWSVSLSGDGNIVAIGAQKNNGNGPAAGHIRVYENNGGDWVQLGQDVDGLVAGDEIGMSISLSNDGYTIASGSPWGINTFGYVRIYNYNGNSWNQLGLDIEGEAVSDQSGWSVSLSSDGNIVAIGSPYNDGNGNSSGHTRVYNWNGNIWSQVGQDIDGEAANDQSGHSVSLSDNGDILAIGAPRNVGNGSDAGHTRIYENNGGVWVQLEQDIDGTGGDQSGHSVSLSSDGYTVAIAAPSGTYAGTTRIYHYTNSTWVQLGQDVSCVGGMSGYGLSLSSDGSTVAVGSPYYVFGVYTGHVGVYGINTPCSIPGCPDSTASNYDPEATEDDGSCEYCNDEVSYTYITACDSVLWNENWYNTSGTYDTTFTSIGSGFNLTSNKQGNNWCFGWSAGIDFNQEEPEAFISWGLSTEEGCSSISDSEGNLLFYTDGTSVWDTNNNIMPNGYGLTGQATTTQAATIIQKPNSTSQYYIFTLDGIGSGESIFWDGLYFSEVDITLNNGLGDVLSTSKNTPIVSHTAEKIAVVKHQNGTDYWVVVRLEDFETQNSNTYHSYLLTENGVSDSPVVSNVGPQYYHTLGYLKASPDGSKIAAANARFTGVNAANVTSDINLFNFNNNTGELSGSMTFDFPFNGSNGNVPYGIEFSPNSQILYVSPSESPSQLIQFNLLAGSEAMINDSRVTIHSSNSDGGALQIGPDGKIYHARWNEPYIGSIESPNVLGIGSNYNPTAVSLVNGTLSQGGLPAYYNSMFVSPQSSCDSTAVLYLTINTPTTSTITDSSCDSYTWNGSTYNASGTYTYTTTNSNSCDSIATLNLTINSPTNSSTSEVSCEDFAWNGTTYSSSGEYTYATIDLNGCDSTATLDLTVSDLSITAELIEPNCYDSEDGAIDITYASNALPVDINWSNGLMFEDNLNIAAGEYSVTITDSNDCEQTETFTLTSPQELYLALNAIDASCDYTLDGMIESDVLGGTSPYQYSWNIGSTEETLTEVGTGDYSLTVIDDQDCEVSADATVYYLGEGCLEIPTVFTPNDDGYNDDWVINGIIDYPNCTMKIFNRWGQLLFESVGYTQTWNGTYDGDALPIADYYFILDLQDGTEARTGTITLKR